MPNTEVHPPGNAGPMSLRIKVKDGQLQFEAKVPVRWVIVLAIVVAILLFGLERISAVLQLLVQWLV